MIPKGWENAKLEELSTLVTSGSRGWAKYYSGKGACFYRITNLQKGSIHLNRSNMKYVQLPISGNEGQRTRLHKGDILISITAELGTIGFFEHNDEIESYINQHICLIRLRKDKVEPKFVAYLLASQRFNHKFQRLNDAGAKAGLNLSTIRSIDIQIPPLEEQKRIAEILSTWDRAIEVTEKLIANSEAQKKALMQKLLTGKERLPGFEGEWQRILLGDAFSERVERNSGELELLSVSQSKGVIRQEEAGRRNISSADTAKYKIVRVGDIAYNTMRMWQGASALSSLNGIVSPAYTILKPHTNQSSKFYSYLFKLPKIIHIFERHSQGLVSDTWNLKYPIFSKIWAYVPKYDEQKAIARVLVTCDEKLKAETLHLRHLQSQKSALMQQLLTGKRRVKIDKEAAA